MSRWLAAFTRAALRRPAPFLSVAAILAAIALWLASGLEIRSSFEELLPSDVPSVAQIKQLIRSVGGDGTVLVSIEATAADPKPESIAAAKELAGRLVKEYLALGPETVRSVEWNVRAVEAWYRDHWPLFVDLAELEKARTVIKTEVSKAKRRSNPLLNLGGEPEPTTSTVTAGLDPAASPWFDPKNPLPKQQVEERFKRYPDGFLMHPDGHSVTLVVRPTGTALGVTEARALIDRLEAVAKAHQTELDAHQLRVGFGGTFPLFVAEYEAILHDVASTALLCILLVLGSLVLFYRDVRSTVSLTVAVLFAVAMTFGLTRLVIGYLNTQTAFLGSIVVGNGINYGLIYLARVAQLRRRGMGLEEACVEGAETAYRGTLLASLGTSVSFGTLLIAANRGFSHFGFIGGVGMLLCWLCTFALVPALLSVFERIHPYKKPAGAVSEEANPRTVRVLEKLFAAPQLIVGGFVLLGLLTSLIFVRAAPEAIERNLENLTNELKGEDTLLRDNGRAQSSLGKSIAGAIALLPSREAADEFCDRINERRQKPRWGAVIQGCDTISSVVPRQQEEKLAVIQDIARRLSDLVLEGLPKEQGERLREVRGQLLAQRLITPEEAPPSLVDRFKQRDGAIGRIAAVTAQPLAKLELGPNLAAFVEGVREVPVAGKTYSAAGENVIFSDLLANIEHEGPLSTVISLVGVFVLVVLFLRTARMSFEVIASLLVGVMMMAGVATLAGIKINFFNFIVFPITFGIAVDYGANVSLRIKERGGDVLRALAEVGPAVALCSWTTIIGYGTLTVALNRALRSFGWYAMIGEVTTIVTALVMLPAIALLFARRPRAG